VDKDFTCDLLVIGAGPAGYTAGLYGARAGLRTVISSPTELSGMMARAPIVGNFPGQVEPAPGREILGRLRQQALQAGAEQMLESISAVDFDQPSRLTIYGGSQTHVAAAVIVATGAMAPTQKAPGEEEMQGRGVCYCAACDGPLFMGEPVLVVGDDEQAAEEALSLASIADTVCLVSSRPDNRLEWDLQQSLKERSNITTRFGLRLQGITGDDLVTGATFTGPKGEEHIPASGVFLYLRGAAPATAFLGGVLETDEKGYLLTSEAMETSCTGVYAAGDVRSKQVRQMVVAASEGCIAALQAERYIRQSTKIKSDRGKGPN
jgi:thioredoxin reductase (NADPH)